MKREGAGPRDVEPGADGHEDAVRHPAGVPARRRRPDDRELRREARGHRRAVPRSRRPRRRRDDLLVHAPLREGARGGEGARPGRAHGARTIWPNLRVLFGGGVVGRRRTCRSSGAWSGATTSRSSTRTTRPKAASTPRPTSAGARGHAGAPAPRHLLRVRPARSARRRERRRACPSGRSSPIAPYSIVVTTASGLYAYELGDIVRFPSVEPPPHRVHGPPRGLPLGHPGADDPRRDRARRGATQSAACPARTLDFGAGADVGVDGTAKSRYVLFVEFQEGAEPADLGAFAAAFDEGSAARTASTASTALGEVALLPPVVVPLASGGARRFLEEVTRRERARQVPAHRRRHEEEAALEARGHAAGSPSGPSSQEQS